MNEADALELMRAAIWTVIVASGPSVGVAVAIGLAISTLQALTQIQEATMTFVPKILAIFFTLIATGSFVGAQIHAFSEMVFARIQNGF